MPSNEVKVENLPEDLQLAFGTDKIEIRVKAMDGEIEDFDVNDVKATVDLKGMTEGSFQIPVKVELPEGYELLEDVSADVTLSEISNAVENNG